MFVCFLLSDLITCPKYKCTYFLRQLSKGKGHAISMTGHITYCIWSRQETSRGRKINSLEKHACFQLRISESNKNINLYFAELYYSSINCKCKWDIHNSKKCKN